MAAAALLAREGDVPGLQLVLSISAGPSHAVRIPALTDDNPWVNPWPAAQAQSVPSWIRC